MDERIKKIAKDACVLGDWGEDVSEGRFFITGNTKQMEKFAELIVKECIQSIEKTIETNCDSDSEKMGCEFAITDLKEHFGVEE